MIEFLDTHAIFAKLNTIIKEAKSDIFLVSPYMNLDGEQLTLLKVAANSGVSITIIYRLNETKTMKALEKVADFPNVKIVGCPELHAKIYANEKEAILSSRNLTTRQEGCSIEVGVLFDRWEDTYDELLQTAEKLMMVPGVSVLIDRQEPTEEEKLGFCIRCGKQIRLDASDPFCRPCFKWARTQYKNTPEVYCHYCGKKTDGIVWGLPMEYSCYQTYIQSRSRF